MQHPPPALSALIADKAIATHFQPLVSVKRKCVVGLEALSRGRSRSGEGVIPPNVLFSMARDEDSLLALDRACRESAMAAFAPIRREHPTLMLSLNIDAAIINRRTTRSGHLRDLAVEHGVPANNVIIEIIESKASDIDMLLDFVDHYKSCGFLIALDDVGAGHSNLDRIPLLQPDILKIDRSLISGIDQHHHKQCIANSLVRMASRIGAVALAEGVETEAEVIRLLEMGVEFYQGFHFARPTPPGSLDTDMNGKLDSVAATFKAHMVDKINQRKTRHRAYARMMESICSGLISRPAGEFNFCLRDFVDAYAELECAYVLNGDGIQISETVCNLEKLREDVRFLYQPAQIGADHSLKDYFLPIKAGLKRFTTDPYISLATGNLCQTISITFTAADAGTNILCADIDLEPPARDGA